MRLDDVLGYINPEVQMPNTVSVSFLSCPDSGDIGAILLRDS